MKKNKIFLAITIGALLLGIIPMVQATTTKRPIDDLLVPELWITPYIFAWEADNGLAVYPHNYAFWDEFVPIWLCDYAGYISERELKDGNLEVTFYLNVKDVPFKVASLGYGVIFEGMMHYTFKFTFILDVKLYAMEFTFYNESYNIYPGDYLEEGKLLYLPLDFFFGYLYSVKIETIHINGAGAGKFTQSYSEWQAGDTGKMKMHQIAMSDKDFKDDHPNYHPEWGIKFWPIEFTFFH